MPENINDSIESGNKPTGVYIQTYKIKTTIKDLDYTHDLVAFKIITTLASAYQMFFISLYIDPNDVILNNLFGGDLIKIEVTLYKEIGIPTETISFELIYLTSDFNFAERAQTSALKEEQINWERTIITIHAVPKEPYKIMSTVVNDVFIGTTLRNVITSLASKVGATLEYDSSGENTELIDQICIPPTTFYKIIKESGGDDDMFDGYLDRRFGLFDGVAGVFCNYDKKIYIKNLTERMKRGHNFTIYQLAGMEGAEKHTTIDRIAGEVDEGKAYYTFSIIQSEYYANAKFATISNDIKHIVKPANKLFSLVEQKLENIAKEQALISMSNNLEPNFYLNPLINRTRYFNEDTGYEESKIIFGSSLAKSLCDLSTISLDIERNIDIKHAFNIGDCIKFKPLTISYAALEGKYILFRTELSFTRRNQWLSTCNFTLIRSNKTS